MTMNRKSLSVSLKVKELFYRKILKRKKIYSYGVINLRKGSISREYTELR